MRVHSIEDRDLPETILCNGCRNLKLWEEDIHPALIDYLKTMAVTKIVIARCDKIDVRLELEWGREHGEAVEVVWRPKVCLKHMKVPFSCQVQMMLPITRGEVIHIGCWSTEVEA